MGGSCSYSVSRVFHPDGTVFTAVVLKLSAEAVMQRLSCVNTRGIRRACVQSPCWSAGSVPGVCGRSSLLLFIAHCNLLDGSFCAF